MVLSGYWDGYRRLGGGNMKKLYAILERFAYIFTVLLLSVSATIILLNYSANTLGIIVAYTCILLIVTSLLKLFVIPSHIIIEATRAKVFDFPLFATNKFYDKKRGLILYNNEIRIKDVEKIELVKLTRAEQKQYIGYKHLFKKYLKFVLEFGTPKYVYVGNYSNRQIHMIVKLVNENKNKLEPN